jgi:hypothetical protein
MCTSQYIIICLKAKSLKLRRENGSLFRSGVDKTPFWKAACAITLSFWRYSFQHEPQNCICISRCNSILEKTTPFQLHREKGYVFRSGVDKTPLCKAISQHQATAQHTNGSLGTSNIQQNWANFFICSAISISITSQQFLFIMAR